VVTAALPPSFILLASPSEAAVAVTHLGLPAPPAAAVYRTTVLPRLQQLPGEVRDDAVLAMLQQLGVLGQQDRGFAAHLAKVRAA
jgi:hypothetical protein